MRLIKQTGWGGEIVFVTKNDTIVHIVSSTSKVDFIRVGDSLYGSHTVLSNRREFKRDYPEYLL